MQPSAIRRRSVAIGAKKTAISLENEFWDELRRIAAVRSVPLNALLDALVQQSAGAANLSSAIRLFVLEEVKARAGNHAGNSRFNERD